MANRLRPARLRGGSSWPCGEPSYQQQRSYPRPAESFETASEATAPEGPARDWRLSPRPRSHYRLPAAAYGTGVGQAALIRTGRRRWRQQQRSARVSSRLPARTAARSRRIPAL